MTRDWWLFTVVLGASMAVIAGSWRLREKPMWAGLLTFVACGGLCFVAGFQNGGIRSPHFLGAVAVLSYAALVFGVSGVMANLLGLAAVGAALVWLEVAGGLPMRAAPSLFEATLVPLVTYAVGTLAGYVTHRQFRLTTAQLDAERLPFERTAALLETEVKLRSHDQRELTRAYAAALEGTRVKTAFLANMSHELRTPMNAVVGLTDLVLLDELTPAQRENLETVRESSQGLLLLLDDLLDLSKIEAGAMRLEKVAFSVREVMRQLERLLVPRAAAKNIGLEFHGAAELPPFLIGDPHRLTQVMTNLIGNSIKFTSQGQVTVTVSWQQPMLQIEVTDTGIGMTPAQISELFQPFTQVDASTTRRFGGTGLGLAIVKRLCELHGGDVRVDSALGVGSVFTAKMLCVEATSTQETAPVTQDPVTPVQTLDGLRVLIAEDNHINQRVAERLLKRLGVTCLVVNNGVEALDQLAHAQWDVVLMDIQMPVMDGLEATRRIRAQPISQPTIIALSANAMEEDQSCARAAGVDDFLSKPITLNALADVLRRAGTLSASHLIEK